MAINPLGTSGSGIDTNAIVQQLMQVESQPLTKLKQKEADYQAKVSAYATLLSSVSSLRSAVNALKDSSLIGMKASVSDTTFLSAIASSSASAGTYNIMVNNIATSQSIYSGAFTSENSEVADLTTYATQKLKIQVGSSTATEITINSSNNTLSGIRDAINNANAGVKASIVNDGSGYRLVLSANSTGASNRIVIQVDENNNGIYEEATTETDTTGLSMLAFNATYDANGNVTGGITNMTQSQAAVDAKLKVDGLEITRSSNTISDLITGVTINLTKGDSYASNIVLTVAQDTSTLTAKLTSFVSAYNQAMSTIRSLRGNGVSAGILSGDATSLSLQNELRAITTRTFNNTNLVSLGLTHDKYGVLSLDSSTLSSAVLSDQSGVITTINTMADALYTSLGDYVNTIIPARQNGYQDTIKNIQKNEENLQRRLQITEANLKKRFIALDTLLNQLQGTSDYLTRQMDMLGKTFGGKK
ncbi:flagellar hook-associated protein 2 [Dissulfurispira thermophila]|uniref:Flagellar hook-associated protein 2 n=1 Tax=Dissulfurispira thermophila TaxID=2715679 RepID=A0A7G1H0J6_9BACT|nr:flagellar filament capping protein FliD [Dissulfurispira thermophila]BCB96088.1 flagellar hook-associated protein 2 [Dissulfurispira thermophila]